MGKTSSILLFIFATLPPADAMTICAKWNNFVLETIQETRTSPPVATRALAMMHTAMYDAWSAYDDRALGTRLGSQLRRPVTERTDQNKAIAISVAAYRVLIDLFPARKAQTDTFLRSLDMDPAMTDLRDPSQPAGVGALAAKALLDFRHADGSNQLGDLGGSSPYADYTGFQPANPATQLIDPDRWQPLVDSAGQPQQWLLPHWGFVRGFALTSGDQFRPGPPPKHENPLYRERCEEIIAASAKLSDRQKMIAEYWEDAAGTVTPPGHWARIAQHISLRDGYGLDQDIQLFWILSNAQFDAGISAWDAKRHYDGIRPISAIRAFYRGKMIESWGGPGRGMQTIRGEEWTPYLTTPPFAEYTSGHSTFSSASAEILRRFTGSDTYDHSVTFAVGSSRIEPGASPQARVELYWATFSDAADEAGLSRRLGGIHFEEGDLRGRTAGRQVARQVWDKAQALLGGGSEN